MRSNRRTTLLLLLAIAGLSLLVFGALSEAALAGQTLSFDNHILAAIHRHARPALTRAMMLATNLGSAPSLAIQDFCAIALFWIKKKRRPAVLAAVSLAGAMVLTSSLKIAFPRERPVPYFHLPVPNSSSFPADTRSSGCVSIPRWLGSCPW